MVTWRSGWQQLTEWLFGDGDSGTPVTKDSILGIPAARNALETITGHVGQLPFFLFKKLPGGGSAKATQHRAYYPMLKRTNAYSGAFDFRETLIGHSLLYGDGRAYISDVPGKQLELWPLMPWMTSTVYQGGIKWHVAKIDDNNPEWVLVPKNRMTQQNCVVLSDEEVFHVKGFSLDGIQGSGLLKDAKRTFRIAIDSEQTTSKQLSKGFSGTVILEAPAGVFRKEEDAKNFLDSFRQYHEGPENAGKPGMLRDGIKANILSPNNNDQQMVEMRRFNREDIALLFGLKSILGANNSVSYNSEEQNKLQYLTDTLMRWLKKFEEEAEYKLLSEPDRLQDKYYFKFNVSALLRTDSLTQASIINSYIASTVYSPNEGREKLDMNPFDGGDEHKNPNTTSGTDATIPMNPKQPSTTKAEIKTAVDHWLDVEIKAVIDAAATQKNFCNWADKHYAWWQSRLAGSIANIGANPDLAAQHCTTSKQELFAVCDIVQQADLVSAISETVSRWPSRSAKLIERIESCLV